MKRTFNLAVVITAVLSLATVAFAVAGTNRAPSPADIPVMVTNRATSTPTTMSASAALRGSTVAKAGVLAQSDGSAASGVSDGTSAGASKSSTSLRGSASGKKGSSAKPKSGSSKGTGSTSGGSKPKDPHDDDHEVVKPPVHDSDEDEDDYEVVKPPVHDSDEDKVDHDSDSEDKSSSPDRESN